MSSWFTEHMFGAKSSSQNTTNTNTMHEQTVGADPGDQTECDGIPLPLPAEDQTSALSSLSAPPASEATNYEQREIVAEWRVPLHGKLYQIEFEHGTTSGRRVLWINNKVILLCVQFECSSHKTQNLFLSLLGEFPSRLDVQIGGR